MFYFFVFSFLDDATSIEMHGVTKDKIIKAGDTIIAECILTGGNPLGKITWYKGNKKKYFAVFFKISS